MDFVPILLQNELHIEKIVTIHYFEYMNDFSYSGEQHDFWEFLCVDKGEVGVVGGDTLYSLKKGEIIFHKPNEFHNVFANGKIAPNLVVMSFYCDSPCMQFFANKVLTISELERSLLAEIILEAKHVFLTPLDDPYLMEMKRRPDPAFAAEQLIRLYLEQLLLSMIRRNTMQHAIIEKPVKLIKKKTDNQLYERICLYLEDHIRSHLTIDGICKANLIGRSQLQKLFREQNQCGVIDYFSRMKINTAKVLIREQQMNFSQISDYLGYTSIHYFSRQFKKMAGMTPSEYASSIKILSDKQS